MAVGTRTVAVTRVAALAGIFALAGCGSGDGPSGTAPGTPVAMPEENLFSPPASSPLVTEDGAPDAATSEDESPLPGIDLPAPGTTGYEAMKLASFWAVERFYADGDFVPILADPILAPERLAKAEVDECFNGVGEPAGKPPCTEGAPKRNQAYVWGLTRSGRTIWFGTVANTHCLVLSGYLGVESGMPPNSHFVCEGDANAAGMGDFRPPHLYSYDLDSGVLTLRDPPLSTPEGVLRARTGGFRSAGEVNGVVFLAGLAFTGGINVFAFDGATGDLLGARNLSAFADIRTWVTVDGVLYAGVANTEQSPGSPGGSVLRWIGEKSTDPDLLFKFEVVGLVEGEAANVAVHEGRLYTTTWPNGDVQRPFGLYRSPPIPDGGLTAEDAEQWEKIWTITDYDPDPVAAMTTGGGDLESFGGKLYWGTMHVPFYAATVAQRVLDLDADADGQLGADELLATALGTHRSIALFALEDGPLGPTVDLLFGETFLPVYDAALKRYTIAFDAAHQNRAGQLALLGASGVGNFFNAYTWAMQVFDDALYVGTFDWTQVARVSAAGLLELPEVPLTLPDQFFAHLGTKLPQEGADLFRLDADGTFAAESLTGVGNATNYGVRTMVEDGEALYVGTANPMNLHPDGGWELLRLKPAP